MFFELEKQVKKDREALLAFPLTPTAKNAPAPIDPFELVLTEKKFELLTEEELYKLAGTAFVFDVECYINYFLMAFKSLLTGKVIMFHRTREVPLPDDPINFIFNNCCVIGYNSKVYDMTMCRFAMVGFQTDFLKKISDKLIFEEARGYDLERYYKLGERSFNHIDLFDVVPLQGSLKLYAGRLHCKRMQDLPYPHDAVLTEEQMLELSKYCVNDLDNTELLVNELGQQLMLRFNMSQQYGVDVRSKSDAQIAEAVIAAELFKWNGRKVTRPEVHEGRIYAYLVPSFVKFHSPVLNAITKVISEASFVVNAAGSPEIPKVIEGQKITINKTTYRIGIGGLHSCEESVSYQSDDEFVLIDRDVVSYYPSIILNQKLHPKHLGKAFLNVYKTLVERRIEAKKSGDKVVADSLKITINGSFGKFGSKWSKLYAPDLMIQVTITGQLALLMLIDKIEHVGIQVVSANTDGVVIRCPHSRRSELNDVIAQWERETDFQTEETIYKAIFSRDVNNYICIKEDGKIKAKGAFSKRGSAGDSALSRNPENFVCLNAVTDFLTKGIPVEETITACVNVRDFVTVRNVKGGAAKSGVYLGKCIRWYFSTEMFGEINYVLSGNKVPNSDGAKPLMELPEELPHDIDYAKYIAKANEMLKNIAATSQLQLPERTQDHQSDLHFLHSIQS